MICASRTLTGAWIETRQERSTITFCLRRTLTGAWIETLADVGLVHLPGSYPHGCVD